MPVPQILLSTVRNPVTALGLPLALGFGSSLLMDDRDGNSKWYQNLRFPPGRPPNFVFPIVWTVLFLGMGLASHLAVRKLDAIQAADKGIVDERVPLNSTSPPSKQSALPRGLGLYYTQLALSFVWAPLFFGYHQVGAALIDVSILVGLVVYMTALFHRETEGRTTWLLAPYIAWLSFATYLNAGIWFLNR